MNNIAKRQDGIPEANNAADAALLLLQEADQGLRELASLILGRPEGAPSVWDIANDVVSRYEHDKAA